MSRCVYAVAALLLPTFSFGQDAPTLKLVTPTGPNLLQNSSFEEPQVPQRLTYKEKGSPVMKDDTKSSWAHFQVFKDDKEGEGKLTVGLTNEFARTGKQSVFVDFDKVTGTNRQSFLMSYLLPIKPGGGYIVGIWGRTDKKRPLTLDQRLAIMKLEVEFFTPDTESQAGDAANRTVMLPGSTKKLYFVSNNWSEYRTTVRTPRDAGWMKVTFRWETGRNQGTTDGTIYFDDASVVHDPKADSLIPIDESDAAKPIPEEGEANEENAAAAPATPAAPGKK